MRGVSRATVAAILSKLNELEDRLDEQARQMEGLGRFQGDMRLIAQEKEIQRLEKELQQMLSIDRRGGADRRKG
jgi:hypothetical protein